MDEFLTLIFGEAVGSDARLALFTLPEQRCRFFASIGDMCDAARLAAADQNVYFGLGLVRAGLPPGRRGAARDVVTISALWADVDFAGPAHPNKSLPASDADFQRLAERFPLPPSILVDSGHGRHAYWLLDRPWLFQSDEDRGRAQRLVHGWHGLVCNTGRELGWAIDNVGELARILRLPGTVNRKLADDPRPVRILQADSQRRYAIEQFESHIEREPGESRPLLLPTQPPTAREAPLLPRDKLESALAESALFRQTWERARTDLADQSASAYDLSLATLAAMRGWTDSEIAALLVQWRRIHGERPEKISRADYLARTLSRARAAVPPSDNDVDLSQFHVGSPSDESPPARYPDPGPIPESLCRVPGFVSQVMDHCLATAPYPNVPLAFCGALALQALLAGRKVRDEADNRTNVYLLALAFSAVGKDWPRKLNAAVLHQIGMVSSLGEKFASGEGIQDALFTTPAMLFQTDEIDGLLQSINKARDGRHEGIMTTLLTMYSAANTIYPMRRKAGKDPPGVIDQPCLILYGTAIPTHYYGALSERMLTNGFMARMLVVESGRRSCGQEPGLIDPPDSILTVARWWADYQPGSGNLEDWHPEPRVVPATEDARCFLRDARREVEAEYTRCEAENDAVGTTIWGRVHEQTRKLALLYAVSESHTDSEITAEAAEWAHSLVMHQTRRMLFMADSNTAENPFHADCLKLLKKLREAPDQTLPHQVLLKRMKMKTKDFRELIETLIQSGDVQSMSKRTRGRTGIHYRFIGAGGDEVKELAENERRRG